MEIRRLDQDEAELGEVVTFIARLNRDAAHHIGYCDDQEAALRRTLSEFELPPEATFVLAKEDGELKGVLGFDADTGLGRAWAYGPFVEHKESSHVARLLWEASVGLLPETVNEVELFFDVRNKMCEKFADALGFSPYKDVTIRSLQRDDWMAVPQKHEVGAFEERFIGDLERLHDEAFPSTYWTARQMIDRIDDHHRVFIVAEGERLLGYLHAEVNPEIDQGSIEFLAVTQTSRRQQVATALVEAGLRWIFSFSQNAEATLVLDEGNVTAERLYDRMGFRAIRQMRSFRKKIEA